MRKMEPLLAYNCVTALCDIHFRLETDTSKFNTPLL